MSASPHFQLSVTLILRMLRNLGFFYGGGVGFKIERVYYESHIAEIEAFLKTTNKMMQTQVDVVDRKLDIEVSRLQSELGKRMDDFNKRFNEMDAEIGSHPSFSLTHFVGCIVSFGSDVEEFRVFLWWWGGFQN
ncbi:hypothetical protein Tco_0427966 [Tanacetum coccineum]